MAELASAIAANILEKLGSLAYGEIRLVLNIKSELRDLEGTISTIKDVLLDAEEKQASNRVLRRWLRQLKDILYDAEDVLDEVECEVLRKQVVQTYGSNSSKVRGFFALCYRLGHKIKNIKKRLGKIAAEKDQFNLVPILEHRHVMHGRRDMTHSFVPPSYAIGRNRDKKSIIDLLMHPDGNTNVNVIPIVGIGGLGKTTVAKLVYDDKCVAEHFELRMWVCVSEDFEVPRLIKEILKSASGSIDENLSVQMWQTTLRNCLENKKFLLVLDDVWNEDRSKWIELIGLLSGGSEGSRIVVTTRSHSVASIVGTGPIHTLKGLSHNHSWSLFVKWAFKQGEEKKYRNLLEIGKEIVKKCKGVPLAIRTLGNLLFSNSDEHMWKFVRDNEIWKLEQKESDILPALKISYDQMPSHLKQCFAFCSLFPKDHWFDSNELIAFWMAHGLIKMPNGQNLELEDVGDIYIKELWSRSFFQDFKIHFWYYRFKMHDLIHDLALKVAQEECSVVNFHTQNIAETVRHLSFSHNCLQVPTYFNSLSKGVRTTFFPTKQAPALIEACIVRFKYIRMLDLSNSCFEELSSSIGTLKHLRYLSLAENERIEKLPNSICELYNLQTLLLHGCRRLEQLPKNTRKMISLRYLSVTTTNTCLFENGVCCFNSLQSLYISGSLRLKFLFQGMDGSLTKIRTLVVRRCKSLTSLDALVIKHLTSLENLLIAYCPELSLSVREEIRDLKLSLRKLKIFELPKLKFLPQWLQGSVNTLQYMHISRCQNLEALPKWFPSLRSLQTLEIRDCSRLSSLPEGMNHLTALRELTFQGHPELIRKCNEEDRSKIAHIPKVRLLSKIVKKKYRFVSMARLQEEMQKL